MPTVHVIALLFLATLGLLPNQSWAYRRAVEGPDNVKNKIYPRNGKLELSGPNFGLLLNQSYVNTVLVNAGLIYHKSEEWGFGIDIAVASNSDKDERFCIENFYNDPNNAVGPQCGGAETLSPAVNAELGVPNYGPAYVPIREIQNIITLNALWTPVYGKQLVLLSATSFFDMFMEFGGSLVQSTFYEKQKTLRNGNISRNQAFEDINGEASCIPVGETQCTIGAQASETGSYDVDGRPDPQDQSHVALNVGLGQKLHFGGSFHIKVYLRNMTLLGTDSGIENLFALYTGFGLRF